MESFTQYTISDTNTLEPYFEKYTLVRQNYSTTQELLKKELDEYIKIGVILNKNFIINKLFSVTIKVCDSIYELDKLFQIKNQKRAKHYFVVEIHISDVFQNRIIGENWFVSVQISDSDNKNSVSGVTKLKNLVPTQSFKIVVPVNLPEPKHITTVLFAPNSASFYPNLTLDIRRLNISYYFTPLTNLSSKSSPKNPFYNISRLYSSELKLKSANKKFHSYAFHCKASRRKFLEMLLKNCYHRLNLDQLHVLVNSGSLVDVNLAVGESKAVIRLDNKEGTLKISGKLKDLNEIKRYVVEEIEEEEYLVDNSILTSLQNLKKQLQSERAKDVMNLQNIKIIYREYQKLISKLPL